MFCPHCGAVVPEGTAQCAICGKAVEVGVGAGVVIRRPGVITLIAVLHFIGAAVAALLVLSALWGVSRASSDGPIFTIIMAIVCTAIGTVQLIAGMGLWSMRPWGRTFQIVLSSIGLISFPIGTLIGGLILYYLFRPGVIALFSGRTPEQLTPAERAEIANVQRTGATIAIAVVAIVFVGIFMLGIVSAIAIPNLLVAMQRAKQKRTTADIRSIATAVQAYATDHKHYPEATTMQVLATQIAPTYIRSVPTADGWGHSFRYQCRPTDDEPCGGYAISSPGKDGVFEAETVDQYGSPGPVRGFDGDIVYSNGTFVRLPQGVR
jgi:type II secretory pathway pseudopilin PulG/uncharacterized membrane protein (DUF2068 family)